MSLRVSGARNIDLASSASTVSLGANDSLTDMLAAQTLVRNGEMRKYPFLWTVLGLLAFCGTFWVAVYMLFFAH